MISCCRSHRLLVRSTSFAETSQKSYRSKSTIALSIGITTGVALLIIGALAFAALKGSFTPSFSSLQALQALQMGGSLTFIIVGGLALVGCVGRIIYSKVNEEPRSTVAQMPVVKNKKNSPPLTRTPSFGQKKGLLEAFTANIETLQNLAKTPPSDKQNSGLPETITPSTQALQKPVETTTNRKYTGFYVRIDTQKITTIYKRTFALNTISVFVFSMPADEEKLKAKIEELSDFRDITLLIDTTTMLPKEKPPGQQANPSSTHSEN